MEAIHVKQIVGAARYRSGERLRTTWVTRDVGEHEVSCTPARVADCRVVRRDPPELVAVYHEFNSTYCTGSRLVERERIVGYVLDSTFYEPAAARELAERELGGVDGKAYLASLPAARSL